MNTRVATTIFCLMVALFTVNCACSSDDSPTASIGSGAEKAFGEAVKADDWEVTVVEAKTQSEVKESMFEHKAGEGAVLHLVKLTLKNTGKEKTSPLFVQHQLSEGATNYEPSADCGLGLKEKFGLTDINPGLSKSGWVCFEIPKTAKPTKYTFKADPILGASVSFKYAAKAASAAAPAAAKGATKAGLTCKGLITKVVDLSKDDGDKAMFKAKDIEPMSKGCEKIKALETHKSAAKCTMDAKDRAAWIACGKDGDKMMKDIMKGS